MKTTHYSFRLLPLLGLLSGLAGAIPPDEAAERTTLTDGSVKSHHNRHRQQELSYLGWSSEISHLFKIPISFEWSYVQDDRVEEEMPKIPLGISPNQTLEQVLNEFCAATGGRLQWQRIRGIIWISPTGSEGAKESLLDIVISLELKDASVWEAFLELSRIINANSPSGRYIQPSAHPTDEELPPVEFRNDKSITLDLQHVTAREAVAAIMAASKFHMEIIYWNFYRLRERNPMNPSAHLSISAYDENHLLLHDKRPYSREELMRWITEADSVVPKHEEPLASEPKE